MSFSIRDGDQQFKNTPGYGRVSNGDIVSCGDKQIGTVYKVVQQKTNKIVVYIKGTNGAVYSLTIKDDRHKQQHNNGEYTGKFKQLELSTTERFHRADRENFKKYAQTPEAKLLRVTNKGSLEEYGITKMTDREELYRYLDKLQEDIVAGLRSGRIGENEIKALEKIISNYFANNKIGKDIIINAYRLAIQQEKNSCKERQIGASDREFAIEQEKTNQKIKELALQTGITEEALSQPAVSITEILKILAINFTDSLYTDVWTDVAGEFLSVKIPTANGDYYVRKYPDGSYSVYQKTKDAKEKNGIAEYKFINSFSRESFLLIWLKRNGADENNIQAILKNSETRFSKDAQMNLTSATSAWEKANPDELRNNINTLLFQNRTPAVHKGLAYLKSTGVDLSKLEIKQFYCIDPQSGKSYFISLIGGIGTDGKYHFVDIFSGRNYNGVTRAETWRDFIKNTSILPADTLIAYHDTDNNNATGNNAEHKLITTKIENTPHRYATGAAASTTMLLGGALCLIPTGITQGAGLTLITISTALQTYSVIERFIAGEYLSEREVFDCAMGVLLVGSVYIKGISNTAKLAEKLSAAAGKYFEGMVGYDLYLTLAEKDQAAASRVIQNLSYIILRKKVQSGYQLSAKDRKTLGIGENENVIKFLDKKIKQNEQVLNEQVKNISKKTEHSDKIGTVAPANAPAGNQKYKDKFDTLKEQLSNLLSSKEIPKKTNSTKTIKEFKYKQNTIINDV